MAVSQVVPFGVCLDDLTGQTTSLELPRYTSLGHWINPSIRLLRSAGRGRQVHWPLRLRPLLPRPHLTELLLRLSENGRGSRHLHGVDIGSLLHLLP